MLRGDPTRGRSSVQVLQEAAVARRRLPQLHGASKPGSIPQIMQQLHHERAKECLQLLLVSI